MTSPPTPFEDTRHRAEHDRTDAEATIVYSPDTEPTGVAARKPDDAADATVVLPGRPPTGDGSDPAADPLPAVVADSSFAPAWLLGVAAVAVIGAAGVGFYALRDAPSTTKARPAGVAAGEAESVPATGTVRSPAHPSGAPTQRVVPAADGAGRDGADRRPGTR